MRSSVYQQEPASSPAHSPGLSPGALPHQAIRALEVPVETRLCCLVGDPELRDTQRF